MLARSQGNCGRARLDRCFADRGDIGTSDINDLRRAVRSAAFLLQPGYSGNERYFLLRSLYGRECVES